MKKNNRIFFRGRSLIPIENTIYHILSDRNVEMEKLTSISHDFFKGVVKSGATDERMLVLMKNIFQYMGWGIFTIKVGKKITIEIKNPPYGLTMRDNWQFLARVLLGYIRLIDDGLIIESITNGPRKTRFTYCRSARRTSA